MAVAYQKRAAHERKVKTYKGDWYTVNSIFGNDWAMFYILLGGREAGKSYSVMRWATINKLRKGDRFKFYWFRLTDAQVQKLLAGGDRFVDPDIARKYGVKTFVKGDRVYTYAEDTKIAPKTKKETTVKTNIKEFATVLSCSTFYNTKGVGFFDNEFDGEYLVVLDEMNREMSEANRFDIVYNFVNLLENVIRSTKTKVKVVMIGNTLDEASDILSAFNFIPDKFGRYKLKSKRAVIDYIMPSDRYKERRKGTAADILAGDASTFTNEVEIDRSLLVNKRRCVRPQQVIMFSRSKDQWFTVWNDQIIRAYRGEDSAFRIPMRRYLDEVFNPELQKMVFNLFDSRAYRFTEIATFKKFQKQLKLIKKL